MWKKRGFKPGTLTMLPWCVHVKRISFGALNNNNTIINNTRNLLKVFKFIINGKFDGSKERCQRAQRFQRKRQF